MNELTTEQADAMDALVEAAENLRKVAAHATSPEAARELNEALAHGNASLRFFLDLNTERARCSIVVVSKDNIQNQLFAVEIVHDASDEDSSSSGAGHPGPLN
jgi:hypothetical protein